MKAKRVATASEIVFSTASQLANSIRGGEISATDVLEAHLDQIARHNPQVNCIATLNEEEARRSALEADAALGRGEVWGPLHGVPVTLKDSLETAGLRTTSSHPPLTNHVPREDSTIAARLRSAGAIILAKTNMSELAGDMQSNSPIFGRGNNPWDLTRTTGGSTGGGAAAVATGMSPMEIGSDGAGSIRHPAHFCGVFAINPTKFLVSGAGRLPPMPWDPTRGVRTFGSFGPLARSVEDLKLALSIIAGPDQREWKVPPVSMAEPPSRPLEKLKFAWTDDFGGAPLSSETRSALGELAVKLQKMGCQVERTTPPGFDFEEAWRTFGEISGSEFSASTSTSMRILGRLLAPAIADVVGPWAFKNDPISRATARGRGLGMRGYLEAQTRRDMLIEALERFLDERDAWLCPVAATQAFPHCSEGTGRRGSSINVDGKKLPYWTANILHLTPFNLTGNPGVVLPLAQSKEGLPIGVQVIGRRWHDVELLSVAAELSKVTGPFRRPPGY